MHDQYPELATDDSVAACSKRPEPAFQRGDVVKLKSGHLPMTIGAMQVDKTPESAPSPLGFPGYLYVCFWMGKAGVPHTCTFHEDMLKRAIC